MKIVEYKVSKNIREVIDLPKRITTILLILVSVICLFLTASCSNRSNETAELHTTLSVDHNFSGKRTIVLNIPQSVIKTGSEAESNLEKVVQKYCPNSMAPSKGYVDDKIQYTFEMTFTDKDDYISKVSDIIGSKAIVSFSDPNTLVTRGWRIEENFESSQLLTDWIASGAKSEGFSGLDFVSKETGTTVSLNDDIQSSEPMISVNCLDGIQFQQIRIETVKRTASSDASQSRYDRTFVFKIAQSTFDEDKDTIKKYFQDLTPSTVQADWLLSSNAYNYTVKFTNLDQSQLRNSTQTLLHTQYGEVVYNDKSEGSTVLAQQNSFNEELDFSNYIGNDGNVPVEYQYSTTDTTQLSECQYYENGSWVIPPKEQKLPENQYGKMVAFRYDGSYLKLRINDGKQYKATSVNIETVPLEGENLRKTLTLKFSRENGGDEAAEYAKEYLAHLGFGAVNSVINDDCMCTYTASGSPDSLEDSFSLIFSGKNTTKHTSESQFMSLRTMRHFKDHLDLSSVLLGDNAETPVYYSISVESGDIIKGFSSTFESDTQNADLSDVKDGLLTLQLQGAAVDIEFDVTSPNVQDIIFFSVISAIIVIIAVIMIFILRNKSLPAPALGGGTKHQGLGSGNSSLSVKSKKNTSIKKK